VGVPAATAEEATTVDKTPRTDRVVWQAKYAAGGIGALPFRPSTHERRDYRMTRAHYHMKANDAPKKK
jgi:hypothetical protein